MSGAAMALRRIFEIPVIQVVVVGEFFAAADIAHRAYEDSAVNLVGLAVRVARMIDKCGDAVAIDHTLAVGQAKQVRTWGMLVNGVRLTIRQPRSRVFDNNVTFLNGFRGVDTVGVDI